jgi:hypothetical protein
MGKVRPHFWHEAHNSADASAKENYNIVYHGKHIPFSYLTIFTVHGEYVETLLETEP